MIASLAAAIILITPQRDMTAVHQSAIRSLYKRMERALETKNVNAMRALLTSDYVQEMPNHRKVGLRQLMRDYRTSLAPLRDIKVTISVMEIEIKGRRAEAEIRYALNAKFTDKSGRHTMKVEGSEQDLFRRVGGRWLVAYGKEHDNSTVIDGRVVEHSP